MYPILGEPFGFPIRAFGVMVALAFLAAYWFSVRQARRTRLVDPEAIGDLLIWVLVGGIAGARLLYVVIHWDSYRHDPVSALKIWQGGIVYYGGFIGAFVAGIVFCRRRKLPVLDVGDVCFPGVMLGQSIGRIGCLLVGDDYGKRAPEWLPWKIKFPRDPDSLLPEKLQGEWLHPTQLYLSFKAFVIFLILTWVLRRRAFPGQVMALALMLYPIGRSICEMFRGDDVERGVYYGLSTSQWISIPIFAIGLGLFISARSRRPSATS